MTVRPFRRISGAQVKSELVFGEEVLDVTRKAIRNVYIRIDPVSGVIRVSAPHSASDTHISAIVERHSSWIRRKRTSLSKSIQLPKRILDDGCELTILGKNIGDGLAEVGDQPVVHVHKFPAQARSQQASAGAFARAHKAGEGDVLLFRCHWVGRLG